MSDSSPASTKCSEGCLICKAETSTNAAWNVFSKYEEFDHPKEGLAGSYPKLCSLYLDHSKHRSLKRDQEDVLEALEELDRLWLRSRERKSGIEEGDVDIAKALCLQCAEPYLSGFKSVCDQKDFKYWDGLRAHITKGIVAEDGGDAATSLTRRSGKITVDDLYNVVTGLRLLGTDTASHELSQAHTGGPRSIDSRGTNDGSSAYTTLSKRGSSIAGKMKGLLGKRE